MNKKICVLGAGRWGKNHIRTLDSLGCLAGVVEFNEGALKRIESDFPKVETFRNVDDALQRDFDGFVVATPAETHFRLARKIVRQGKPVLIEKPIALTVRDARILQEEADAGGSHIMVGHLLLFHPAILKIKKLIDAGKIGKLQYLYSNRLNLGTVRTEENILWSFAPHDISIFQFLIEKMPQEIVSRGGQFLQPSIHDITMTVLTYPDNIVAHIFVSWLHPFKEHRIVVIGSKGMLVFEDSSPDRNLRYFEKGIDWIRGEPIKREGASEVVSYQESFPLTEQLKYFVSRLGRPFEINDAPKAIEVLEILERASQSLLGEGPGAKLTDSSRARYEVHPTSFVDEQVEIGEGTKIWHFSHIQSHARIGKGCSIGQNVYVGSNVSIGDHVKIQNNVSVYEGVTLEDHVFCGPSMVFTNVNDPRSKYPQASGSYRETLVRKGASIGANATIVCGHTIGRHAFIGAGAVVTGEVPDYALMVGVPARAVGWVCECGEKLPVLHENRVDCSRCDLPYSLEEELLVPAKPTVVGG